MENTSHSKNIMISIDETELLNEFLKLLPDKERRAYEIAKSHLGMSFQLEKSIAYLKWKEQKQTK